MSEQNWFVYQGNQQLGPFVTAQVKQMLKAGWKDWRPVEDCLEELGMKPSGSQQLSSSERRYAAPRASIQGRVIVHNNGQMIIGSGVNISASGIFVETTDQIFTVGDKLKLSVRIDGFVKAFNVFARVVRYNSDPRFPVGFGLTFVGLDKGITDEIERMVASKRLASESKVG
jgi:Tfp pilus assembly protein PilZ